MIGRLLFWLVLMVLIGLSFFGGSWIYWEYHLLQQDLPQLLSMADYQPALTTVVYSADNKIIGEFGFEDRELVRISEVPQIMQEAILATEDTDFYQHNGVNFKAIIRAMRTNLEAGRVVQGGSTITQQVARELFLSKEKKFLRKIKEAIIAVQLESRFTKNQILQLYFNQIYFGHGAYGIKSAARRYFNKTLQELTLAECALLAGMPQAPSLYSPYVNMERALTRRATVLARLVEAGFISPAEAATAEQEPIALDSGKKTEFSAPYFLEYVRRSLEDSLGTRMVHTGGLKIYTTLDTTLQQAAEDAVFWGLHSLTARKGFRKDLLPPDLPLPESLEQGTLLTLPLTAVSKTELTVEFEGAAYRLKPKQDGWSIGSDLTKIFTPGESVCVVVVRAPDDQPGKMSLYQYPEVQSALVSIKLGTGEVVAWVGGSDFEKSKFDRVVQARRQPGSSFKPIIYAAAMDTGFTPADIFYDAPIVTELQAPSEEKAEILTAIEVGSESVDDDEASRPERRYWRPDNSSREFYGPTTLRVGLEKSRNLVAIKLLAQVGVRKAVHYARRMGIESPLNENLSLALGSSGVTLLEFVAAYGVFANEGDYVRPLMIKRVLDRHGRVILESIPEVRHALTPATAFIVTNLLRGVVEHGTGARARSLGRPLAGKTGTTNDYRDAWFNGFSRHYITGVWVGLDEPKRIGANETGARAALPIWQAYMSEAHRDLPPLDFPIPEGITVLSIDADSGLLASNNCTKVITEAFITGTEPLRVCDSHKEDKAQFLRFDSGYDAASSVSKPPAERSPFEYSED